MAFDMFIGSNFRDSKDADAWSYSVEDDDALDTIQRVVSEISLDEGEELVIVIRPEYEGG